VCEVILCVGLLSDRLNDSPITSPSTL